MLENHIFSDSLRYEAHRLIYTPKKEMPIELTGMLAASVLAALLVDTPEGDARGIAVDGDAQREDFFLRYERELRRENGGLFKTEVDSLCQNYMELAGSEELLFAICGNDRLYDLAFGLTMDYMHRLVQEQIDDAIYIACPWYAPFAQWLVDAAREETRRCKLKDVNWTDPEDVYVIAETLRDLQPSTTHTPLRPTFVFEGLSAEQIMHRYWEWLWASVQEQASLMPNSKTELSRLRKAVLEQETDESFLSDEIEGIDAFLPEEKELYRQWIEAWIAYITRKLKPERPILFWTKNVTEERQEQLLDYLKIQERQPNRYLCLTTAIYALRYLGYVRRACSLGDMRRWLSKRLVHDYTSKSASTQFSRAWNAHGRYTAAVQDELRRLAAFGVTSITA